MSDNILETKGLTVTFGGLNANDSVNLNVPRGKFVGLIGPCLLYTSPSPRDRQKSRMPSSA